MKIRVKYKLWIAVLGGMLLVFLLIPLPKVKKPYSTVLYDESGAVLTIKLATDGQWRLPEVEHVPSDFETCISLYEDRHFRLHPGVNPISLIRAFRVNLKRGRVVQGGSTLTMQLMRIAQNNPRRNYIQKAWEVLLALKYDLLYSKDDILQKYVSYAPYGGNIVGAEVASLLYFNRDIGNLSWAEYATLAVLPNAPALIHLGKNRILLQEKRDRLLKSLYENQSIDSITYSLALMEPLPQKPKSIGMSCYHLMDYAQNCGLACTRVPTTINKTIQRKAQQTVNSYINAIEGGEIRNACALIVDVKTLQVKAYVGNSMNKKSGARFVDLVQAPRSSGSILKPFLYGKSIEKGLIHPSTLQRDVPISIGKFSPNNFNKQYEGIIPAGKALARSLNIPATVLLKKYSIAPFHHDLQSLGFSTINRSVTNYGLTLVLGGAEVTLWDLAKAYGGMAHKLWNVEGDSVKGMQLWQGIKRKTDIVNSIDLGAWWLVSEALCEVSRPGVEQHWQNFSSQHKIAWKTGTSHGFRDAWAVGYNADYLVATWVGNAEGDGRPGLTGTSIAAPLMFQLFQHVELEHWFQKPVEHLRQVKLCAKSGLLPNVHCPTVEVDMPLNATMNSLCSYHKKIFLDQNQERVFANCASGIMRDTVWFDIDPIASYYYKKIDKQYRSIPTFSPECASSFVKKLDIIYPTDLAEVMLPINFKGEQERIVFEAAHKDNSAELFWHLDNRFLGTTSLGKHKMDLLLNPGNHILTLTDGEGNQISRRFKAY